MSFKSKAHAIASFKNIKKKNFLKESIEVTSGVKAPTPEVSSGVNSPSPQVTSGLDKSKSTGVAKVETKKANTGELKTNSTVVPEVSTGLDAAAPEVKTGLTDKKKPEVTSLTKENAEITSGVKSPKPEVEEGVKSPTPQVTSGLKEETDKGESKSKTDATDGLKSPKQETGTKDKPGSEAKQAKSTPPTSSPVAPATEGFEGKMDEASEVKHKSLEEKAKALKAEIEALEKEMSGVKELGVKKFVHNTKKEEVAKLGEEIKTLKEKSRDPMKLPVPDRDGNKHMPKPTQNIPSKKWKSKKDRKGWKKEIKKGLDEKVKVLSEGFSNAYISKASRKNLISERVLATYWEKAVKLQEENGEYKNKSNKSFWYGVVKNFNALLNEQELVRAKEIMTEREKFNLNTEKFINCLASDDYVTASNHMNSMVESSLKSLIDTRKVQYQKELGEKVSKKLREV